MTCSRCYSTLLTVVFTSSILAIAPSFGVPTPEQLDPDGLIAVTFPDTVYADAPSFIRGIRYDPPYVIDWVDSTLTVNGMTVWSTSTSQRSPTPTTPTAVHDTLHMRHELTVRAGAAFISIQDLAIARIVRKEIYDTSPLVEETWLTENGSLAVRWKGEDDYDVLSMTRTPGSGPPPDQHLQAISYYESIKRSWSVGRLLFLNGGYKASIRDVPAALQQIDRAIATGDPSIPGPLIPYELEIIIQANN